MTPGSPAVASIRGSEVMIQTGMDILPLADLLLLEFVRAGGFATCEEEGQQKTAHGKNRGAFHPPCLSQNAANFKTALSHRQIAVSVFASGLRFGSE